MRPFATAAALLGVLVLMGSSPDAERPASGRPAQMQGKRPAGPAGRRAAGRGAGKRQQKMESAAGEAGEAGEAGATGERKRTGAVGNMLLRQGSPSAAVASFRSQLEVSPDSGALHTGLGKALARLGRCEEALEHLWPYVGTLPFSADAALAASTCSSRMGLLDDAIFFDRMAVDLNPTSARALTNLALDLSTAGDAVGTDEALEALLFLRADRDASNYARAVLALRSGDLDAFDLVLVTWEQSDGPSLDTRRLEAQAWLDLDAPAAAMATLDKLRRTGNGQQVRHLRAEAERRMGFPAEAASFVADRPQSVLEGVDTDAIRARVFTDLGRLDAAHEVLDAYDILDDSELIASAWYLASREGRTADLPALEAAYEQARTSPHRDLADLHPWAPAAD